MDEKSIPKGTVYSFFDRKEVQNGSNPAKPRAI
jgi:hypothetical protein